MIDTPRRPAYRDGMAKIFLTGASGFVGSHLARLLVAQGHDVTALHLPGAPLDAIADIAPRMRIIEGDLKSFDCVAPQVSRAVPDVCIHLAWYVEPGKYLDSIENIDMAAATLRLADTLSRAGCKRFVGVGTSFEYDLSIGATHAAPLQESAPIKPNTLYASAKAATFSMLQQLAKLNRFELAWARLFYLYGPGEYPERLFPQVLTKLLRGEPVPLTDGSKVRDYLHVEDVASALWAVAESGVTGAVNIGSGERRTLADIVGVMERLTGARGLARFGAMQARPDDPDCVLADVTRLTRDAGWRPRYTLESGLAQTLTWWKERMSA